MGCKRSMILYWDYIHITIINHPYLHISYIIKYKPIKNNKKNILYIIIYHIWDYIHITIITIYHKKYHPYIIQKNLLNRNLLKLNHPIYDTCRSFIDVYNSL